MPLAAVAWIKRSEIRGPTYRHGKANPSFAALNGLRLTT
jgi:hypothetical protein